MKIDLKKLETAFHGGREARVRKQISFLCRELFPGFLPLSNTTSCRLSVNKIQEKTKRLFELGTSTDIKIIFSSVVNL